MAVVASAAPELPFWYYHFPKMSEVNINMFEFVRAADESGKIPNLMGIKFANEKLMEYNQIGQFKNKKYNNLIGLNEEMTPALATGTADGFVGSGLNFMSYVVPLKTSWDSGSRNETMALQVKTNEVIQAWKDICPGLSPAKSILKMTGIDFGPLRLP